MPLLIIEDEHRNILSSTDVTGGGVFAVNVDNSALLWSGKAILYFTGVSGSTGELITDVVCTNVTDSCDPFSSFWTAFNGQHET